MNVQSVDWKPKAAGGTGQALLLVHGVGNVTVGFYEYLRQVVDKVLGPASKDFAVYILYYDALNQALSEKVKFQDHVGSLIGALAGKLTQTETALPGDLAKCIAQFGGDVIWPILSLSNRQAIRSAYLAQLQTIGKDGEKAGFPAYRQKVSIICHSLGCFHTYEALHAAAKDPAQMLNPATDIAPFRNVIFMASPVQMIRSVVTGAVGAIAPGLVPPGLACAEGPALSCPYGVNRSGEKTYSARRWVSLTGELDPVGGYFCRKRGDWAYMDVAASLPGFAGQISRIDKQDWLGVDSYEELRAVLLEALAQRALGQVPVKNPHSWEDYLVRNAAEIKGWLLDEA